MYRHVVWRHCQRPNVVVEGISPYRHKWYFILYFRDRDSDIYRLFLLDVCYSNKQKKMYDFVSFIEKLLSIPSEIIKFLVNNDRN